MFIVVTKTQKQVPQKSQAKVLPEGWPAEVSEYMTHAEAKLANPRAEIFTLAQFREYSAQLQAKHALLPDRRKPWWKFWSKS